MNLCSKSDVQKSLSNMKQGKKFDNEPTNSDETLKRNFQIKINKLSCCMDYVKVFNSGGYRFWQKINEEREPRAKFYESKQNKRDLCNLKEKLSCFRGNSLKLNEYHIIYIIINNWDWNYRIKRILKAINSCMFYKKFKKKIWNFLRDFR